MFPVIEGPKTKCLLYCYYTTLFVGTKRLKRVIDTLFQLAEDQRRFQRVEDEKKELQAAISKVKEKMRRSQAATQHYQQQQQYQRHHHQQQHQHQVILLKPVESGGRPPRAHYRKGRKVGEKLYQ